MGHTIILHMGAVLITNHIISTFLKIQTCHCVTSFQQHKMFQNLCINSEVSCHLKWNRCYLHYRVLGGILVHYKTVLPSTMVMTHPKLLKLEVEQYLPLIYISCIGFPNEWPVLCGAPCHIWNDGHPNNVGSHVEHEHWMARQNVKDTAEMTCEQLSQKIVPCGEQFSWDVYNFSGHLYDVLSDKIANFHTWQSKRLEQNGKVCHLELREAYLGRF